MEKIRSISENVPGAGISPECCRSALAERPGAEWRKQPCNKLNQNRAQRKSSWKLYKRRAPTLLRETVQSLSTSGVNHVDSTADSTYNSTKLPMQLLLRKYPVLYRRTTVTDKRTPPENATSDPATAAKRSHACIPSFLQIQ